MKWVCRKKRDEDCKFELFLLPCALSFAFIIFQNVNISLSIYIYIYINDYIYIYYIHLYTQIHCVSGGTNGYGPQKNMAIKLLSSCNAIS